MTQGLFQMSGTPLENEKKNGNTYEKSCQGAQGACCSLGDRRFRNSHGHGSHIFADHERCGGGRVLFSLFGSQIVYVPLPIAIIRTCPVRLKRSTSRKTWFQVSSGTLSTNSSS